MVSDLCDPVVLVNGIDDTFNFAMRRCGCRTTGGSAVPEVQWHAKAMTGLSAYNGVHCY